MPEIRKTFNFEMVMTFETIVEKFRISGCAYLLRAQQAGTTVTKIENFPS